jgi:hypothetical protein
VEHAAEGPAPEGGVHHVDALQGEELVVVRDVDVGGGESQGSAAAVSPDHRAPQGVGSAEGAGGVVDASLEEGSADPAGGDGGPVGPERVDDVDVEAHVVTDVREGVHVSRPAAAEAVVVADDQVFIRRRSMRISRTKRSGE